MSAGKRCGRFVGAVAGTVVHFGGVAIENTGTFGKDFVAGVEEGYTDRTDTLAANRIAKYQRIMAENAAKRAAKQVETVQVTARPDGSVVVTAQVEEARVVGAPAAGFAFNKLG